MLKIMNIGVRNKESITQWATLKTIYQIKLLNIYNLNGNSHAKLNYTEGKPSLLNRTPLDPKHTSHQYR